MTDWESYPTTYREKEVKAVLAATGAGECVSVIGLSGAGKSNLMRFMASSTAVPTHRFQLIDCNRLLDQSPAAFLRLVRRTLGSTEPPASDALAELDALESAVYQTLQPPTTHLTLLLDRFDRFTNPDAQNQAIYNALRALRDIYKFQLTYVIATRRPLSVENELAELFHANTIWLGPLSESDARWNVGRYAARKNLDWDTTAADKLIAFSKGYPSFLRAASEAYAAGAAFDELEEHPAVQARVNEFWKDDPTDQHLALSGLANHPLLQTGRGLQIPDAQLTAKEQLLLDYFQAHPNVVCDKDELITAVWPEDEIFEQGVRDSSLAQLVRRLRVKIEPNAADPQYIQTIPGRGYLFKLDA
ncbi:MAG: winged helix-turn-helix domain-containing protein [Candidatus Promineifilaceae bacterium]